MKLKEEQKSTLKMYVNKTKVKTLVVRNLLDSYAKKRVVYPYDPRPLPATLPRLRYGLLG